ncbi:ABC transporter substrate-binding protein [Halopseudomonas pachastrellae]|nr:ABC transporter substrate-binding protein [Halopseudomonas pachastrellae]
MLLELQPDLILTATDRPETLELYRAIAPTVVTAKPGEPWQDSLQLIANVLGEPEAADCLTASYQTRVQQAREALAAEQGQTMSIVRWNPKGPVYCTCWRTPSPARSSRSWALYAPSSSASPASPIHRP